MKLKIEINLDNASFGDNSDIQRILRGFANKLESLPTFEGGETVPLVDVNGNSVGFAKVIEGNFI
jgi:hypothetical protein